VVGCDLIADVLLEGKGNGARTLPIACCVWGACPTAGGRAARGYAFTHPLRGHVGGSGGVTGVASLGGLRRGHAEAVAPHHPRLRAPQAADIGGTAHFHGPLPRCIRLGVAGAKPAGARAHRSDGKRPRRGAGGCAQGQGWRLFKSLGLRWDIQLGHKVLPHRGPASRSRAMRSLSIGFRRIRVRGSHLPQVLTRFG
jgi:hypothetical protein